MNERGRLASRGRAAAFAVRAGLLVGLAMAPAAARAAGEGGGPREGSVAVVMSADGEGHVGPCGGCAKHRGRGGLPRRATALRELRSGGAPLVVDAGNFLFGEESVGSGGAVIVAAYDALGYDVVNVSHRDFRLGKEATRTALQKARFAPVSCNVIDEANGATLFSPYVVRRSGDVRVAVIGATEVPAGLTYKPLPHLKQQLAGLRLRPAVEALDEWLARARAESDCVVLLYYGSAASLEPIRQKHGSELAAILVGGTPAEAAAVAEVPPRIGAEEHGKGLTEVRLERVANAWRVKAREIAIEPELAPDAELEKVLVGFAAKSTPVAPAAAPVAAAASAPVREAAAPAAPAAPTRREPKGAEGEDARARIAVHPDRKPKGLAGVGLTAEQVNRAIDRGADYLWKELRAELAKGRRLGSDECDVLDLLALVHAGAPRRFPELEAALHAYVQEAEPYGRGAPYRTYQTGLFCMLVEGFGDPAALPRLRDAARYLVETQGEAGSWDYGEMLSAAAPPPRSTEDALEVAGGRPLDGSAPEQREWARLRAWSEGRDGDTSCTQFAMLGLHAAERAGFPMPREAWRRALAANRARTTREGGFSYGTSGSAYGSMSCAGICAVAIAREHLGTRDPEDQAAIEGGLAWLAQRFTVATNPALSSEEWLFYYLYSVERVGRLLDTEFLGDHEWYPEGARRLVDAQGADGSWIGQHGREKEPPIATSFALLFLTRATPSLLAKLPRGGSGTLRPQVEFPPVRLYVILDASGSMLEEMGGRSKFDVARAAVGELVSELPQGSRLALRAYGHRKRALEEGSNEDVELVIPPGPVARDDALAQLARLRARGRTPLALSLREAKRDLESEAARGQEDAKSAIVLLLTDGGEDTRPMQDPVAAAREFDGLAGVSLQVVGFDIGRDDWSVQLRALTAAAHGRYLAAGSGDSLLAQLRMAVFDAAEDPRSLAYSLADAEGRALEPGRFGAPRPLPEGRYRLAVDVRGRRLERDLWINTDATTSVRLDLSQLPAGTDAACPGCGARPDAGARFCARCGARIER